jgi:type I restriction-modification system DNA methylase subunit
MQNTLKGKSNLLHGVLFRGNAEEVIRTKIIKRGMMEELLTGERRLI